MNISKIENIVISKNMDHNEDNPTYLTCSHLIDAFYIGLDFQNIKNVFLSSNVQSVSNLECVEVLKELNPSLNIVKLN